MEKHFTTGSKTIYYTDTGQGGPLVLLHGYLETKEVWGGFAHELSKQFRVIAPDIPGHGKSSLIAQTHTMGLMAQKVYELLNHLNVDKCTMVGHSMGGYVLLAFAQLYPEKLGKMVMFHSSVYADGPEKLENRLREIELVEQGKLKLIANSHLPNTFATDNLSSFEKEISGLKKFAHKHEPEGVCALLRGMRLRHDQQKLIEALNIPVLFVFGQKDNYISIESAKKMVNLSPKISQAWLKNSGHMGFVEEKELSIKIIRHF